MGMSDSIFRLPGMVGVLSVLALATIALLFLSMPSEAGTQCSRIKRVSGFETLINNCNACMTIQVVRDRAGYGKATLRTFKMVSSGEFPLPFKGKGKTRIVSEEACGGATAAERNSEKEVAEQTEQCIIPVRTANGVVMANRCGGCRAFVIERLFETGERSHKSYALMGQQSLPLDSEGAVRAEIVHDAGCKL